MNEERTIAEELIAMSLEIGALALSPSAPFLWASGHYMPVYNDNRRLLSHWKARRLVTEGFRRILDREGLRYDGIAGTASAGIAPATALADALETRLYYVRTAPKDHGMKLGVEGAGEGELDGRNVILVEDLVSTGGSSARAGEALSAAGARVIACVAVFSYGFSRGAERLARLPGSPPLFPLVTMDGLIEHAAETGVLPPSEIARLREWMADPFGWWERYRPGQNGTARCEKEHIDG